jgi:hypothetical protein
MKGRSMSLHKWVLIDGVTTSGAPLALSTTSIHARALYIMGRKPTGANTGNLYIGDSTTAVAAHQGVTIATGTSFTLPIPDGDWVDLSTIYFDVATSTDGFSGGYIPA